MITKKCKIFTTHAFPQGKFQLGRQMNNTVKWCPHGMKSLGVGTPLHLHVTSEDGLLFYASTDPCMNLPTVTEEFLKEYCQLGEPKFGEIECNHPHDDAVFDFDNLIFHLTVKVLFNKVNIVI